MARIPFYSDKKLAEIVKVGDERKRWGQTNRREIADPFHNRREIVPQHPITRLVAERLAHLEFDKFHAMGDPNEWERLSEIKELALAQVQDDAGRMQYQRIGRQKVDPLEDRTDTYELWPELNKVQLALSEALDVYVDKLTMTQIETLRYRYWRGLSQNDAAKILECSKKNVERNEYLAKNSLRKKLLEAFPEPEREVTDAPEDVVAVS